MNHGVPVNFSPEESNILISTLFASSMDGLAFITPDFKVRYANEPLVRMVKIPIEKAFGNPIEHLIPWWSQMDEVCQKTRLTGEHFVTDFYPFYFENQPERGITYWKITIAPVNGTEDVFLGWILVLRDVTKNKQNEDEKVMITQELDNKIKLLNQINENSLAGLAILDGAALTYKWVNRAFAAFLNLPYQLNGLYGLSFEESIYPEQKIDWLAKLREVAGTQIPLHDFLLNQKQNYWNCSILPIFTQADVPDLMIVVYNITEKLLSRKLIEEYACQAGRHLQQLETVIENMSDGVIIFDLNGKILNLNSEALQLLEYYNGRDCPVFLSQIQADLVLYDLEGNALSDEFWPSNQIIRGEIVHDFEAAIRRTDTCVLKYSSYNGALIKDTNNVSTIGVMTIRDITEREILIRQLEQKQAHLQAVLEQMPCGVIMFDALSGKTVLTNRKYKEIWRVSVANAQMGEKNCPGKLFHHDGRPYLQTEVPIVRSVCCGETVANEEIMCQRQDNSWMVAICNSTPILDREGKIVAGVVVFSDITELKEATTKATLANQLQQIIEFLPDGTFVVDQNRKVIAWNRALELLTGISKGDIIGTDSYKGIFSSGNQKTLIDEIFEGISVGSDSGADQSGGVAVRQILLPILNQRENVLLDLKATPIRNQQGEVTGMIETIRDITHQKQMEAEAIRMQKLDSLGILAGGIAHDFNNILAAILANLQLAALKMRRQEDITKYLDDTIETTRKASDLTHQLLTFAKGGAPVKKTASILELIMDTVEFTLRGSKVKAKFHFQENPWAVEIDEGQITQVINNLTINAIQAMLLGGFLEITFENIVLPAESKYNPGRYVKLSVRDSGCGIPTDIINKIFDPFFTTKEVGNGLGLSTSYSIIKRHNGYIEVESIVGTGTTFYIYLPALAAEVAIPEVSCEVAAAGESKILLMDDDEIIRQVVSDMLVYYGHRITIAKDGTETIDFYRQAMSDGERFDVVIMDLTVPGGMGGLETMTVLRRIDPRVKAIISSGYANDPVMSDYKQYVFCGFVAKPYKFDELIEVLNTALNQK
jgi:PAS domain S-box-containing protein